MLVLIKRENKHKDKWDKDTVETSSNAGSSRIKIKNTSGFIACFIALIFITGLSGVVSACETHVLVNPGESIQDAIDSLCPEGGVVELAAGIYNVSDPIIIRKSNITIRGTHDSVIRSTNYKKNIFNIPLDTSDRSVDWPKAVNWSQYPWLENITFKGFRAESTYGYVCNRNSLIEVWKVRNITVEDVYSYGYYFKFFASNPTGGDWGASANDLWNENILIKNNEIHGSGIGIHWSKNIHIENNNCSGAHACYGIDLNRNNKYMYVKNNTVRNSGQNADIELYASSYFEVTDNVFEGSQAGIGLWCGPRNAIISNNTITGASYYGMILMPQFALNNITIKNNRIYNNKGPGIYTTQYGFGFEEKVYDANITNNAIYNNAGDGIRMTNEYIKLTIKNNIITNNSGYGINYMETIEPTTIKYNDVWGNALGNYKGTSAGTGDISEDPLFADLTNGDFHLKSQYGRWNGTGWVNDNETSPCIDAGDPSEKDPDGTRINMGAYGGTSEASKSQSHGSHGIETYNISGYVKYANGTRIYNARITNNVTSAEDYTNESGYYILTNFANGTYNITASKSGFYTNSIIVTIAGANVENADIILTEDITPPTISNVDATSIASSSATITWITDENSDSKVYYGETESLGTWKNKTESVTSHSVTLAGLTANTTYYYQVYSTDEAGNTGNSSIKTFKTAAAPSLSDVIIWDTNHIYDYKFYDFVAFADKDDWTQVPYGTTDYTFNGDAVIENEGFYLFLHSNPNDCVFLYPKRGNSYGGVNEVYKVHDTGTRYFGDGTNYTKILKNTPDEVIVEHAGISTKATPPINVVTIYRIPRKPWIEVEPVENVNQQGMHDKSRLAAFVFQDVDNDIILDADKHGDFIERINPPEGCIGEINFNRASRLDTDEDFMWFLTFPHGVETNSLTYQTMDHPDCYWEWDCRCCVPRSVSQNFAYLGEKVVIGVLNFEDNWKREDVGQYLNAGETYTSSFTAPYAGKWRVAGVFSDDDWNITDYFSEVEMNEGEHFTFTSPRNGTLEYLVMYMFDRTENTPENITTIMDVYRETMGITPDITSPAKVNDLVASNPTSHSITLTWTAPGDDGNTGTASQYDIRYSTSEITEENWNSATQCTGEPAPKPAGSSETFTVTGLSPNTTYYFALKTADEVPNWSPISNSPSGKTTQVVGGLVGYWKFDEGAGTTAGDSSGNNNNGTLIDNPDWVDGKIGKALEFNGSTNYVAINDSDSLDGFDEITIEAWVKPILGQRGAVVSRYLYDYNIPINERVYELTVEQGGTIGFALSSDGSSATWLESSNTLQDNEWNHIAAVSDGNTMMIYINGEQDPNTEAAPASLHSSSYNLQIGTWEYSPNQRDTYFNGVIDEVKIYNRALSAEEIKADYEAGIAPASSSISGFITYACNETGLAGATVNLSLSQPGNGNETPLKSTVTDSNGSYKFISVYPGTYNITASRRGFWSNSSSVTVTGTPASESYTLNLTLWLKGDLNNNGKPADNADVAKMENASIGEISPDWRYDLNRNGIVADAGDLAMIKDASAGNIIILE